MMGFGLCAITFCIGYLAYWKHSWKEAKVYTAIDDNDSLILKKKKSHWD